MTPPEWIMTKPEPPPTGVFAWIQSLLFWIKELLTEKPSETIAICGTPFIDSGRLKFTDEFNKKHGLDEKHKYQLN